MVFRGLIHFILGSIGLTGQFDFLNAGVIVVIVSPMLDFYKLVVSAVISAGFLYGHCRRMFNYSEM